MNRSETFLRAAEELDKERADIRAGACAAIQWANNDSRDAERACAQLDKMFGIDARATGFRKMFWGSNFGRKDDSFKTDMNEAKQCRVLMLLFMSAMTATRKKKATHKTIQRTKE